MSDEKTGTSGPEPHMPMPATPKVIESRELLEGRSEVLILHQSEVYRLRLTRNGKLILQK